MAGAQKLPISRSRIRAISQEDAQGGPEPVKALPATDGAVMEGMTGGRGGRRFGFRDAVAPAGAAFCAAASGVRRGHGWGDPWGAAGGDACDDDPGVQICGRRADGGDRRATAGNTVVYDRADKVLEIDRHSLMAIAGVPATAWEMARVLEHSFQFYRRTPIAGDEPGWKGARALETAAG